MKAWKIKQDTDRPLVPSITSANTPPLSPSRAHSRVQWWRRLYSHLQLPRASLVILVWNTIVGATYGIVFNGGLVYGFSLKKGDNFHPALYTFLLVIITISTIQFFLYPLGGLLADIRCGRYKVMVVSNILIWCGYGFLIVLACLMAFTDLDINRHHGATITDFQIITIVIAFLLFILGFTGFQANVVQFGLDQFLDAPSEKLSLFLHWVVWTDTLGQAIVTVFTSLAPCITYMMKIIAVFPAIFFIILSANTVISCCKHQWFHCEPRTKNPYGTVYRVLKFSAKHDKPLRRSAFTFADDERPTRIEFAKQRFGGPFTTETVEDVKTFLRILVMLLAIGPTYIVLVAARYVFPLHGIFTIHGNLFSQNTMCKNRDWVLLASGNLTFVVSVVMIPAYTLLLFCVKRRLPKIVPRLVIGLALLLLADLSMTLSQLAGHYHLQKHHPEKSKNMSCLFNAPYGQLENNGVTTLGLPSWTLVFPNVLDGLAMPLTYISILEFISAQSPHSMKGVLLGVFYAVRGLFTVLGCVLVFPFTSERIWGDRRGVLDCGLSYYMVSVLLGLVGVLLFCAAARWYQYRRREDQPFGPHIVEAVYEKQIRERRREVASEPVVKAFSDNSILNYGTMVGTGN